jgi:GTPase SAR1 family protein
MSQVLLIGPRASGKLTYLSGLAGWKYKQKYNSKIRIETFNQDTKRLEELWKDIVCQGCKVPPTDFDPRIYQFSIDFSIPRFFKDELQHIDLVVYNVPGEIFEITDFESWKAYQENPNTSWHVTHETTLIMIMIDCSMHRFDDKYAGNIDTMLKHYLRNTSMATCRIALVISQSDAVDVWINRKNTTKVVGRFRQVLEVLNHYSTEQKIDWKLFVNSTFGGLGRGYLEANSTGDNYSWGGKVLKDPSKWKPYGLFSPLYWLCTGKDLNGIDYY